MSTISALRCRRFGLARDGSVMVLSICSGFSLRFATVAYHFTLMHVLQHRRLASFRLADTPAQTLEARAVPARASA